MMDKPWFHLIQKAPIDRTMKREQYYKQARYLRFTARILRQSLINNGFEKKFEASLNDLMTYGTSITEWITPKDIK